MASFIDFAPERGKLRKKNAIKCLRTWSFHGDSRETPPACRNRSVAERPGDTVQQASLQGNVVAVEGNDCACREKRTDAGKGFRVLVSGNVKDRQDKEVANL